MFNIQSNGEISEDIIMSKDNLETVRDTIKEYHKLISELLETATVAQLDIFDKFHKRMSPLINKLKI